MYIKSDVPISFQVTEIEPKCALISLSPPELEQIVSASCKVTKADLRYQLKLMEKTNSNKKDCYNAYSEVYKWVPLGLVDIPKYFGMEMKLQMFNELGR